MYALECIEAELFNGLTKMSHYVYAAMCPILSIVLVYT